MVSLLAPERNGLMFENHAIDTVKQ